jgi:DNA-binding PadR family transcriptional regulator
MAEMSQRAVITVTSVMSLFETKFNIQISPGTIYPIFKKLEKKGYIKKLPNEVKTLYVLTDLGKSVLVNLQQNSIEIQNFVSVLLIK